MLVKTAVKAQQAGLAGRIVDIFYWFQGLVPSTWTILPPAPQVPVGTALYLLVNWHNESDVPVWGVVQMNLTSPDGSSFSMVTSTYGQYLEPGAGRMAQYDPFTLDQPGEYQGEFILTVSQ
jgi:heme/copper-type cytochrome/quinol oxidase subunit 2